NNSSVGGLRIDNSLADYSSIGQSGGTRTLTLGTSGIAVTGGGSTSVAHAISLSGAQTWDIETSAVLTTNGRILGTGPLTKTGEGTLVIANASGNDNAFSGGLNI